MWTTVYGATDDCRIHIIPTAELNDHIEGLHCPCGPDPILISTGKHTLVFSIRHALVHEEMANDDASPV